jgi:hypothetical protein
MARSSLTSSVLGRRPGCFRRQRSQSLLLDAGEDDDRAVERLAHA